MSNPIAVIGILSQFSEETKFNFMNLVEVFFYSLQASASVCVSYSSAGFWLFALVHEPVEERRGVGGGVGGQGGVVILLVIKRLNIRGFSKEKHQTKYTVKCKRKS